MGAVIYLSPVVSVFWAGLGCLDGDASLLSVEVFELVFAPVWLVAYLYCREFFAPYAGFPHEPYAQFGEEGGCGGVPPNFLDYLGRHSYYVLVV